MLCSVQVYESFCTACKHNINIAIIKEDNLIYNFMLFTEVENSL